MNKFVHEYRNDLEYLRDPEGAFSQCVKIAKTIEDRILSRVAVGWLEDNKEKLMSIKGSDWQHHNEPGGLVIHICHVALLSCEIAYFYSDKVDLDLIKFCALTHDAGKLEDYVVEDDFSCNQSLRMNQEMLGHSYEGARKIEDLLRWEYLKYPNARGHNEYIENVVIQCTHCIGTHMIGYGAISKQMMLEVFIVGKADHLDAELNQTVVDSGSVDGCNWFITASGNKYYKSAHDGRELGCPRELMIDL